jgi:hypothetical protein
MENLPWYGILGIIGVSGWAVMVIIGAIAWGRSKSREPNTALLARLDAIDNRLAAVEKTLNDIP